MRLSPRAAVAAMVLGLGGLAAPAAAQAPMKVGYVDVAQVMEQVPGRADAQAAFEKEAQGIRAELQRMSDSLQTAVQAYQKEQATLTAAVRQTREQTLQQRQQSYQQRAQALQERGAQPARDLVAREAVEAIRPVEPERAERGHDAHPDARAAEQARRVEVHGAREVVTRVVEDVRVELLIQPQAELGRH